MVELIRDVVRYLYVAILVCLCCLVVECCEGNDGEVSENCYEEAAVDDTLEESFNGNFNHENILGSEGGQGNGLGLFELVEDVSVCFHYFTQETEAVGLPFLFGNFFSKELT